MHVKPKTHTQKKRESERELSDLVQKPKAKNILKITVLFIHCTQIKHD